MKKEKGVRSQESGVRRWCSFASRSVLLLATGCWLLATLPSPAANITNWILSPTMIIWDASTSNATFVIPGSSAITLGGTNVLLNGGVFNAVNGTNFPSSLVVTNAALDALRLNNGANLTNLPLGHKVTTNAVFDQLAVANGTALTNLSIANKVTTNAALDALAVNNAINLTNFPANLVTTNAALDALRLNNGANLTNLPLGHKVTTNAVFDQLAVANGASLTNVTASATNAAITVSGILGVLAPVTVGTNNVIDWSLGFMFTQSPAITNGTYTFTNVTAMQNITFEYVNTNPSQSVITLPTSYGSWGTTNVLTIGSNKTAVIVFQSGANTANVYGVSQSFR